MTQTKIPRDSGFTMIESCMALTVCVVFGLAAFSTNQRLLFALKSQRETTAATMVIQQRVEAFRATTFAKIASKDYVKTNILLVRTGSEAPLGSLTETFEIGVYPPDGSGTTKVSWDANHTSGQDISTNTNLATANLLRVDVTETWISATGQTRTRQLSSIIQKQNPGPLGNS